MIQLIFWFTLILIILSYFGYPVILTLFVSFKKRPYKKENIEPSVTLLIPAHNEEAVIQEKIENSLSLDYPKDKFEILLILDECTDRTKEIAERYINRGIMIIEQKPRKGKIAALNLAIPQAKGEILVFTDANSMYEKDAIRKLVRNFADEKVGCVCGELKYVSESSVGEGENLYWKYEKFLKTKESQLQSLLVVNGSIYAIRKKLYEPVEETLADDFVNPMRIAKKGYGLVYEPEAIAVEKAAESTKDEFNRKIRITSQGLKASFVICGTILSSGLLRIFQFIFHKFIRWLVLLFLIIIFVSNLFLLGHWFYQVTLFGQISFYLFALIGYLLQEKGTKIKIFNIPFYFCMVNLASLIGFLKFLSGGIKGTWEKAETTRK
ncbi:MAG: hypothetical protein AMJ78_05790 [Omnitrophica WOR_2 bacterium SM23_29]|nr:MAG: hypothetical protein AMJ78_05790 [Omnitrophica WOR_2 bacterium SM23_29]